MWLENYGQQILVLVRQNEVWAAPIAFVFAFGESLVFTSLFLPGWAVLMGIGAVLTVSRIEFWEVWVAASIGAALGDWLSYWIGVKLENAVYGIWPLSQHPDLRLKSELFVKQWGVLGIFIGRFLGPLRATVPLIAGIFALPYWPFQLANFTSAFVWAAAALQVGKLGSGLLTWLSE